MSDQITTRSFVEFFGMLSTIGWGIWRFIKWVFAIDGRLNTLETQTIESNKLHEKVETTMTTLVKSVTSLETTVNLIVADKLK